MRARSLEVYCPESFFSSAITASTPTPHLLDGLNLGEAETPLVWRCRTLLPLTRCARREYLRGGGGGGGGEKSRWVSALQNTTLVGRVSDSEIDR